MKFSKPKVSVNISPNDERLTWAGAISLEETPDGFMPWRIPHEEYELHAPNLVEMAAQASGVRLLFKSDSTTIDLNIAPKDIKSGIDLFIDGEFVEAKDISNSENVSFAGLEAKDKRIEMWLPQNTRFYLKALKLDEGSKLQKVQDDRPCWITYGSSITHCSGTDSPSKTWPSIVARDQNLDLTSLGYSGNCHLDPMIARLIRDTPADFISVCAGINIQGNGSMNERSFRPALFGTVKIIREKHPDTPLVLISPICCPDREETPNHVGFHLVGMRAEVKAAVEALRSQGDKNLHYVDGLEVYGPDLVQHLPDGLHPNTEGYGHLGKNFIEKVAKKYFIT